MSTKLWTSTKEQEEILKRVENNRDYIQLRLRNYIPKEKQDEFNQMIDQFAIGCMKDMQDLLNKKLEEDGKEVA